MGFLSRVLGPRGHRRARPKASQAGKRVGTSKNTRGVRRGIRHLRKALRRIPRSLTRNNRSINGNKLVAVYHHGTCTVNHRSRKAASSCRRTY